MGVDVRRGGRAWAQQDGTSGANAGAAGRRSAAAVSSGVLPKPTWPERSSPVRCGRLPGFLRSFPDDELDDLLAEMIDLPCLDTSLHLPLPRLLTPDVDRLLVAIEEGDLDEIDAALPAVLARVDTPVARARLARAVIGLRERGRIDPRVAAVALFELAAPKLQSLVSSAVVHAAGVALGDVATPSGLLVTG